LVLRGMTLHLFHWQLVDCATLPCCVICWQWIASFHSPGRSILGTAHKQYAAFWFFFKEVKVLPQLAWRFSAGAAAAQQQNSSRSGLLQDCQRAEVVSFCSAASGENIRMLVPIA